MAEGEVDFNLEEIMAFIPHRYPFLLIDRVINAIADKSAVGVKAVTVNEPYFRGLPLKQLAMPGMLIVEAMAQTAAVVAIHTLGSEMAGKFIFLMGLHEVRFHHAVKPGDMLFLHTSKIRSHGPFSKVRGEAKVDGKLMAEATMTAMILDAAEAFQVPKT
ncbi:MAG: 3-hydroxyacyl-ACP dehydratase FabZ [Alphaproteobacteria bacterium]